MSGVRYNLLHLSFLPAFFSIELLSSNIVSDLLLVKR